MTATAGSSRLRIILGIDYGTTFTGVSYVTSEKTSVNDIDVLRVWPGNGCPVEGNWKTPTVIAYQSENPSKNRDHWGYEVRPNMKSCSWTKLLLDTSAETAQFDDPSLRNATGSSEFFHLPPGKTPQQVCQDYLAHLYRFVTENLKSRMTPAVFNVTPMTCYFTMPAIWTDKAQAATRKAAIAAGFGSRPGDTLHMITEPEAAAIAALKHDLLPGSVNAAKVGDNILVLDCGGGTVDLTAYNIRATYPTITFDEICVGIGGKCGSTYIDRNLHKFLGERFGTAFENVQTKHKGPGSRFMAEFEKVKHSFGSADDEMYEIGPIPLGSGHKPEYFDEEEEAVILSKKDVEAIFAPVVEDILRLVTHQVAQALRTKGKHINLIVLVGGFGNSDHLKKAIDTWAQPHGIECIRPTFCQAAIVRGAAIRGLEGTSPSKLICRRHYGFEWGMPFRDGIHDEKDAFWSFGVKYCRGHMKWMIEKGAEIDESTFKVVNVRRDWSPTDSYIFTDVLYSCNLDTAPERQDHSKTTPVGLIRMDLSGLDMSKFATQLTAKGVEYDFCWQFRVDLRTTDGVLRYSSLSNGETLGVTTIDFRY